MVPSGYGVEVRLVSADGDRLDMAAKVTSPIASESCRCVCLRFRGPCGSSSKSLADGAFRESMDGVGVRRILGSGAFELILIHDGRVVVEIARP